MPLRCVKAVYAHVFKFNPFQLFLTFLATFLTFAKFSNRRLPENEEYSSFGGYFLEQESYPAVLRIKQKSLLFFCLKAPFIKLKSYSVYLIIKPLNNTEIDAFSL